MHSIARNHHPTFADLLACGFETFTVTCLKCPERRGRYSTRKAIAERGDLQMLAFLAELKADCPAVSGMAGAHAVCGAWCRDLLAIPVKPAAEGP